MTLRQTAFAVAALATLVLPATAQQGTPELFPESPASSATVQNLGILDPSTLTFTPEILRGAPQQVLQINVAMRQLISQVPEALRPAYIANMTQLNLRTPEELKPYEGIAEQHRALLLQAYLYLEPEGQKLQTGIEKILGIRTEDPQGAAEDFMAVARLWQDRGFAIVQQPELPPHGPLNGIIRVNRQPCLENIPQANGENILTPHCMVGIPVDSDARNAARLWLMMRYMDASKMEWSVLPGQGGQLSIKHPETGAQLHNVALLCSVPNTFALPDSMSGVKNQSLPGVRIFISIANLFKKNVVPCFPAETPTALTAQGALNFRDQSNWVPHYPKNIANPGYQPPAPPAARGPQ
jgi:hypothetical protein